MVIMLLSTSTHAKPPAFFFIIGNIVAGHDVEGQNGHNTTLQVFTLNEAM